LEKEGTSLEEGKKQLPDFRVGWPSVLLRSTLEEQRHRAQFLKEWSGRGRQVLLIIYSHLESELLRTSSPVVVDAAQISDECVPLKSWRDRAEREKEEGTDRERKPYGVPQ